MVDSTDLKIYKTTNNLGGAITGTEIISSTPNNLFTNVPKNEQVIGEDYYACIYLKNTHSAEAMENFKLWLTNKSFPHDTEIKWAFDPTLTSIVFDGSNDYVDCTNDATLWSQSLTKFSFSFWIFPTLAWDGNSRRVVNHGGTSANSFRVEISGSTVGEIRFMLRDAVPTSFQANTDTLVLNQWNFIICVYDNSLVSDNAKIYVNGILGDSQGDSNAAINGSFVLQLADSVDDFKGNMKDFRWWTNTALTQTDVTNLYNGDDHLVATNPNYWLKMNEGTGNPVDSISGTKVGTLTNGAAWQTSAQIIADKYTAPAGVTWNSLQSEPSTINYGKLAAGSSFPIWIWYHVNANAVSRLDDSELFSFKFNIPQGGTGGGGSGATYHYSPYATMPTQAVTVPHTGSLSLSTFTIACWFRTTKDYTADLAGYLVSKGDYLIETAGNNLNYALLISTDVDPNNVLEVLYENSTGQNCFNVSGVKVNDGQWRFGAGSWDGVYSKVYVDGLLRNTERMSDFVSNTTPDTGTRDLIIGGHESFMTYQGDLDEVRIWNVALTDEEILNLYQNGVVPRQSNIVYENTFGGSTGGGGSGGTGGNPPPVNTNYKVAVSGDWGCESETDDVIDLIQNQGYNHVVGVGDNAYAGASCWTSRFNPLKSIMNSAYGNHEYSESGGVTPYKTFFGHNLTYFTYKFQNIQFFVIDTNINFDVGSAQYTAITNAINASLTDSTVTWRCAVFHHPMFGADSDHSYNDNNFNQTFQSFFQTHKINFAFAGHNHNWQRTYQVAYNSGDPESPTVVDNSSPYSASAIGLIHIISGTGGHDSGSSLYSLGSQPSFQAYQNRTHNGVWEMVASNNGQTLTCSFVDTNGNKYDTFVINA